MLLLLFLSPNEIAIDSSPTCPWFYLFFYSIIISNKSIGRASFFALFFTIISSHFYILFFIFCFNKKRVKSFEINKFVFKKFLLSKYFECLLFFVLCCFWSVVSTPTRLKSNLMMLNRKREREKLKLK